ncbi:hypothetical protein LCGC14_0806020 [marine sediment metagenome]|uniref:Uncharacterized protein n=1 Tax=marine sediment metagenome TaxID=412755 RepID=A0A0F9Q860_9ZZZZ
MFEKLVQNMEKEDIHLKKKVIKFSKKPAKHGDYYIFHIPNSFIKEGLVDPSKKYTVYLEEHEED